jgi:hypothetical protein
MSFLILNINEDNLIEWDEMTDSSDDTYINSATVTFSLFESDGTTLVSGPTSMSYVSGSNGKYQGVLDKIPSATLTPGEMYILTVTALSGSTDGFRRIECSARYHKDTP